MEILQRLFASNTIYALVCKTRCVVKKVLWILFLLILLCIGATAFYILNADWVGNHRDKISEQFYNATGKVIKFEGDITFKFFPVPYLHANNVKIYNSKDMTEVPLAEINNLDAKLELKPLFAGEFNITNMEVSGIKFMVDWDNGFNWQSDLSADQKQFMADSALSKTTQSLSHKYMCISKCFFCFLLFCYIQAVMIYFNFPLHTTYENTENILRN